MTEKPRITYFGMGPWPVYVGFTTKPKAFAKEMARLGITDPPKFVANDHSHATLHTFTAGGPITMIITAHKDDEQSPEAWAGLIAHEATHVAQLLWEHLGEDQPGREAEAYIVQMVTQCCLQELFKTGRVRKTAP